MSTSYYVFCKTCKKDVTDPNACDNAPEIPQCIVRNIIPYAHLAMFLEELPLPRCGGLDYDIRVSGHRLDLQGLRTHCTHDLAVYDEYGYEYIECKHCHSNYCPNVPHLGEGHRTEVCCDRCDHTVEKTDVVS